MSLRVFKEKYGAVTVGTAIVTGGIAISVAAWTFLGNWILNLQREAQASTQIVSDREWALELKVAEQGNDIKWIRSALEDNGVKPRKK